MATGIKIRIRTSRVPAAVHRRGPSPTPSVDPSDEGGYSAVEDISDDEDAEEENVFAAEENHIINRELHGRSHTPRPQAVQDEEEGDADDESDGNGGRDAVEEEEDYEEADVEEDDDEDEDEDDEEEDMEDEDEADDDEQEVDNESETSDGEPEAGDDGNVDVDESAAVTSAAKRQVRFAVPTSDDESASDSTQTDDEAGHFNSFFPDIFVDKNNLDPAFRREIDEDDGIAQVQSFWDGHPWGFESYSSPSSLDSYSSDEAGYITEAAVLGPPPIPSVVGRAQYVAADVSAGYESADGDTTEEDVPPPNPGNKKSLIRESVDRESSDSDASPPRRSRGTPRVGSLDLERCDKPVAVYDPLANRIVVFTPNDLADPDFEFPWFGLPVTPGPVLRHSTAADVMAALAPLQSFPAWATAVGTYPQSDDSTTDEYSVAEDAEDDPERGLDITDFITWNKEADGDVDGGGGDASDTQADEALDQTPQEAGALGHISALTVGAFRRNQVNRQLILNEKATQDSLAFSGPYNATALRGIRSDRIAAASSPLTPVRRRSRASDFGASPSVAASQKRKASSTHELGGTHRKRRSIPGVGLMCA